MDQLNRLKFVFGSLNEIKSKKNISNTFKLEMFFLIFSFKINNFQFNNSIKKLLQLSTFKITCKCNFDIKIDSFLV